MTDSNLGELEPLEPMDGGAASAAPAGGGDDAMMIALRSGLGAPAFNPFCRDKTSYKFLFAGVVMLVGCLMPFGPNPAISGYQTMSGGVYTLIAIGMIWTWWGAISNNRSSPAAFKWLLLCFVPLIAGILNMMAFDPKLALEAAAARGHLPADAPVSESWKALFADMGSALAKKEDAALRVEHFWRLFGPGRFFVFLGGLLAEISFFGGVLGGAKQNKLEKQARQMAAAERKRR